MEKRFNDDIWVRCPVCRHKLFKKLVAGDALIEIKCSSCKSITVLSLMDALTSDQK